MILLLFILIIITRIIIAIIPQITHKDKNMTFLSYIWESATVNFIILYMGYNMLF